MSRAAKVLAPGDVRRLRSHAAQGRYAIRNEVAILLSFNAGLRAGEIAGLDWAMVLGPDRKLASSLAIGDKISKYGRGRRIPMNQDLRSALLRLHRAAGRPCTGPVIQSQRGGHMKPRAVVNWFKEIYVELSLQGCSSHSGRRTFITRSARLVAKVGGSLRDVQELAGHRSLLTTERYIAGDRDAQRKLVRML